MTDFSLHASFNEIWKVLSSDEIDSHIIKLLKNGNIDDLYFVKSILKSNIYYKKLEKNTLIFLLFFVIDNLTDCLCYADPNDKVCDNCNIISLFIKNNVSITEEYTVKKKYNLKKYDILSCHICHSNNQYINMTPLEYATHINNEYMKDIIQLYLN